MAERRGGEPQPRGHDRHDGDEVLEVGSIFVAFSACLLAGTRKVPHHFPMAMAALGRVEVETAGPRRDMAGSQKIDDI